MRSLLLALDDSDSPKVKKICDAFLRAIREGRLAPSERLPSTRTIAQDLGVHRQTVMTTLEELVLEGWIFAEARRGYRVASPLPDRFFSENSHTLQSSEKNLFAEKILILPLESQTLEDARFDFRSGRADLRLFPIAEFKDVLVESLRKKKSSLLGYGFQSGYPPFIKELTTYLRRVRSLQNREYFVTHGYQEAIYLASRLILERSDGVAVEELCYPGARDTFLSFSAKLHPVAIDAEGMRPDDLERVCRDHAVKMLFLTPNHHFPTTATMSIQRRADIYAIASRYKVLILEDDFDHEYHFHEAPPPPLASNDPDGLVIYVSTFSKVMFPSARLGFMALPPGSLSKVAALKEIVSIQNDILMQDAFAAWMRSGAAMGHLNRTRKIYETRLEAMVLFLEEEKKKGLALEWKTPDGGMALWLKTPWDCRKLRESLSREGILVHDESMCRVDGGGGQHLRLGFARHSPEEMREGLTELFAIAGREGERF